MEYDESQEREFDNLSVDALMAEIDMDYDLALQLFDKAINKFPDEGSLYIRRANVINLDTNNKNIKADDYLFTIELLDKAERLIKAGISKHSMDKWDGLRDLYFLRGTFKYLLGIENAIQDIEQSLNIDPNYQKAMITKGEILSSGSN